jgi:hypothetical protein
MNVILLAPVWLQLTHLLVAEVFWILLVLASADILFADRRFGFPHARKMNSEITYVNLRRRSGERLRSEQ